jgi:ABC-type branched-subunit amino acid transport system substrate-binding protein
MADGKSIDELKVGDSAEITQLITEELIREFARIIGDFNPIHLDEDYAQKTRFKGRIAHGALSIGFFSNLLGNSLPGPGTIYLSHEIKFLAPVRIGDTLKISGAQPPIKIGIVQGFSGALEAYAKQMLTGFKMGLEYGTKGKNEIAGRKVDLIVEDDQIKPDVAKRLITKLYADDKVDLVVGTTSSAAALAMLPVAQEFKKILLVEPAVADSITGSAWNRYVFRTGRNSGQDAISNAKAVAKPGVYLAGIAQDYAFGRDGIAAYKAAAEKLGAKMVHEEYAPMAQTDHTSSVQRIIDALKDKPGENTFSLSGQESTLPLNRWQP